MIIICDMIQNSQIYDMNEISEIINSYESLKAHLSTNHHKLSFL